MTYHAELDFLRNILTKCRLQFLLLDPFSTIDYRLDFGLRHMFGKDELYDKAFYDSFRCAEKNTIYRLMDPFQCKYIYFLLPDTDKPTLVVLGPYLSDELTYEQILENSEKYGVQAKMFQQIEKFFGTIPVVGADTLFYVAIDTFAEHIWGDSNLFRIVDINHELIPEDVSFGAHDDSLLPEETAWNMSNLEARYAYENELMQAVSLGQIHKAERLLAGFTKFSFERRVADPIRNMKNYCIIMNTLLRKAAESGGVHPLYLDRISADFAKRIEMVSSTNMVQHLMDEMFHDYCRLVKKNATQHYSPPVQKAILHINNHLNGDLSLKSLSSTQNMNASYLSALFKKETGQTVTDYVNQMRVHQAERLLGTTKLQIQTVAQHCGISDVNYFSKIFKKYTGKSPIQYRKDLQHQISQFKNT